MTARGLRKCFRCGQKKPVKLLSECFVWADVDHAQRSITADFRWVCKSMYACDPSFYRANGWTRP